MSSEKNWRTEVTAIDHLGHQKKATSLADRRPVIRKPSDLAGMGPAISQAALLVEDWNSPVATYNGYYSSSRAANGPRPDVAGPDLGYDTHEYVAYVITDSTLGGTQVLTDLETGSEYSRTFLRAPTDPNALTWSPWGARHRIPPTAFAASTSSVTALDGISTDLPAPVLDGVNFDVAYSADATVVSILEQGIYTGVIGVWRDLVGGGDSTPIDILMGLPQMGTSTTINARVRGNGSLNSVVIPFTFINTRSTPADLTVALTQYTGASQDASWVRLDITRTGDAV